MVERRSGTLMAAWATSKFPAARAFSWVASATLVHVASCGICNPHKDQAGTEDPGSGEFQAMK
jgi:hypothetical protein